MCAVPAAGCVALGCAARVTRQKRNTSNSNYCCRACQGRYPRWPTLVSALKRTLNAPGGSPARCTPPHEPSAESALLPTSRGEDDEACARAGCAAYLSKDSEASRPTFFHSAATCLHSPAARRVASRKTRRGSAGPANGTWSAAVKSWAARSGGNRDAEHLVRNRMACMPSRCRCEERILAPFVSHYNHTKGTHFVFERRLDLTGPRPQPEASYADTVTGKMLVLERK